jgi:hypothetical protein
VKNWGAGIFDPIWQWATSQFEGPADRCARIHPHPFTVPLLRYIGLRVGFHIPHSSGCLETIDSGSERLSLAKDVDLVKLLTALLSMPMEAELLHGVLVVRTPIFYIITHSVPTEEKYRIEVSGDFIPKEGAWPDKAKNL